MKKIVAVFTAMLMLTACSGPAETIVNREGTGGTDATTVSGVEAEKSPPSTGGTTAALAEPAGEITVAEQVLVDEKDIKITLKSLDSSGWMGPSLKVLIENNSTLDLTFQTRASSVNGYMIDTMMSPDVSAGKKVNDEVLIMKSDLEAAGITTIADVEFSFHIFTSGDWEDYLDTEPVVIKTSAAESYEYSFDDSGETIFENADIRIISKGISQEDAIFGRGLVLFIENLTDQSITVQARDVSVNGFMVNSIISSEIAPQKRIVDEITFMDSDLEENDIQSITDLEFSFHIFETDGWDTIVDTDKLVLTFS